MVLVYFIVDHWSKSDCNVQPVKVRSQKLRGVTSLRITEIKEASIVSIQTFKPLFANLTFIVACLISRSRSTSYQNQTIKQIIVSMKQRLMCCFGLRCAVFEFEVGWNFRLTVRGASNKLEIMVSCIFTPYKYQLLVKG